jgi:hypothetical protein
MAVTTKAHLPLVSASKFDVSPVAVADETGYTGVVGGGTGRCIAFASMPKGRAILMGINIGALSGSPTGLTVGLGVSADGDGGSLAFVTGTTTEFATVTAGLQYQVEIPLSYVSDSTKYYSACVALKGGGSTTAIVGTVSYVLDPNYSG